MGREKVIFPRSNESRKAGIVHIRYLGPLYALIPTILSLGVQSRQGVNGHFSRVKKEASPLFLLSKSYASPVFLVLASS